MNETSLIANDKIKITQTFWYKSMLVSDFEDGYYELFIKNGDQNYNKYWMSSRYVTALNVDTYFGARLVKDDYIFAHDLYRSSDMDFSDVNAVRPVITLNLNVQLDVENLENGGVKSPFKIK